MEISRKNKKKPFYKSDCDDLPLVKMYKEKQKVNSPKNYLVVICNKFFQTVQTAELRGAGWYDRHREDDLSEYLHWQRSAHRRGYLWCHQGDCLCS